MNAACSPELRMLVMACQLPLTTERRLQLIQLLDQHSLNWNRLYTLANRHRVTPFLYRSLQELPSVSERFLAILQRDCRATATDNLIKLQEYHRVAALLTEHRIDHIAFKGVYLAEHTYPESSLRSIGDFDILVDRPALFSTIRLLESNQYQLGPKYRQYLRYSEPVILSDLHEVSLFKPFFNTSHFDIDLHWEIECFNKHYGAFHLPDLQFPTGFVNEHQLILLVVHHGVINIWQQIVYVNDLYFSLNDKPINWPWLLEELRRYELETVFFVGLYWCQEIWNLTLPPQVEALVLTDRIRGLAEAYEKNWEVEMSVLTTNPGLKQVTLFARGQTRLTRKLKVYFTYFSSFIFRPIFVKIGRYRLYIPKELGFITVFARMLQKFYHSILPSAG